MSRRPVGALIKLARLAYFLEERRADVFLACCSSGQAAGGGRDVVAAPSF